MKKLLFSIAIASLSATSFAQNTERCVHTQKQQEYFDQNPAAKQTFEQMEKNLQKRIQKNYFRSSSAGVYQVPVVIHVMHIGETEGVGNNISDAQIMSGMQQINDAFRNVDGNGIDAEIEFVLAKQNPDCEATTGIIRYDASGITDYATDGISGGSSGADEVALKAASKWPNESYYNIWLVSEINGNDGGFGTQGYAYFPGASSARDGAIVLNTAWGNVGTANVWNNQSKTAIHELGHGFNLYHTFNTLNDADTTANGCPSNTSCSTEGDKCCDTDPHKVSASFTCTDSDINECTGNVFGDVVHNYMDYSDQDCQIMFTQDQIDRMRATLEGTRAGLLTSKGLTPPLAVFAEPTIPSCEPTTDSVGLSAGYAGIMQVDFNTLSNRTSYASNDQGYRNFADDCLLATYVHPDSTYSLSVETWANTSDVKAWIDYNNDGVFASNELVYDQTIAAKQTASQNVTIPATAVQDQYLRMRVLLDLNNIPDACHDPQYGQAEDYSIYIHKVYSVSGFIFEQATGKSSTCGVTGTPNLALSLTKNGVEYYSTTTDIDGNFNFENIAAGTYDLYVDSTNHTNSTAPEITVATENVEYLEFVKETLSLDVCNNSTSTSFVNDVKNISVAPNPTQNSFTLQYNTNESVRIKYQFMDLQGRIIESGMLTGASIQTKTFNTSQLAQGVYTLMLGNETGNSSIRIVKK